MKKGAKNIIFTFALFALILMSGVYFGLNDEKYNVNESEPLVLESIMKYSVIDDIWDSINGAPSSVNSPSLSPSGNENEFGTEAIGGSTNPICEAAVGYHCYYVDNALTTGANTGVDWTNAWRSLNSINWNTVVAGDMVYISGGSVSKTYNDQWSVGRSGTSGHPVTIRPGQDLGHNGVVIFDYNSGDSGTGTGIDLSSRSYITIDGNYNGQNHIELKNLWNIHDRYTTTGIFGGSSSNLIIDHMNFTNMNNPIRYGGGAGSGNIVRNSNFNGVRGDVAIGFAGISGTWDSNQVYNNYIEIWFNISKPAGITAICAGPDGIQSSNGVSIYNNKIKVVQANVYTSTQHPDSIQMGGQYTKIFNNEFINVGDSMIDFDTWSTPIVSDVLIYNNIFRSETTLDENPEYFRFYNSMSNSNPSSITNFKIFNNLFIDSYNYQTGNSPYALVGFNGYGANPTASGVDIKNNIFYNLANNGGVIINVAPSTGFSSNSFNISNNIYYNSTSVGSINYLGQNYPLANWISNFDRTGKTSKPLFLSYAPYGTGNNFSLSSLDTSAKDSGISLSSYFTTDKVGVTRPQGAGWDIGPYEYTTGAPTIYYNITLTKTGNGNGNFSINDGPVCNSAICSAMVAAGNVKIEAYPNSTSNFINWNNTCAANNPCTFAINANTSIKANFTLIPLSAPIITTQPQNATSNVGGSATFSVAAAGNPAPSYQWQTNSSGSWQNITGATLSSYTLSNLQTSQNNTWYRVNVSNSRGSVLSSAALLRVNDITIEDGLVAYYKFDDASGTTALDSSGNGHTGAVSNGAWTNGKINGALNFVSSNSARVSVTGLNVPATFTITAWIYLNSPVPAWQTILGQDGSNSIQMNNNYVNFASGGTDHRSVGTVATGQWAHVGIVNTGTNYTIYINGVAEPTVNSAGPGMSIPYIGSAPSSMFFNGMMDEVRVYNKSLSSSQINTIYNYNGVTTLSHPADTNQNNSIDNTELANYVNSYLSGSVSLNNVLYALTIAQSGRNYNYIGTGSEDCTNYPWDCFRAV